MRLTKQHFILLADLIMVICVWLFRIQLMHVVSLLMTELFISFYFLIFYFLKKSRKKDRFLPSTIVTSLGGLVVFLGILNIFHLFLPPYFKQTQMEVVIDMLEFQEFWISLSYFSVLGLIIFSNILEVLNYQPSKKNDASLLKANHILIKFMLLAISIIIIDVGFHSEDRNIYSDLDLVKKIIATLVILSFAVTDFRNKTKANNKLSI